MSTSNVTNICSCHIFSTKWASTYFQNFNTTVANLCPWIFLFWNIFQLCHSFWYSCSFYWKIKHSAVVMWCVSLFALLHISNVDFNVTTYLTTVAEWVGNKLQDLLQQEFGKSYSVTKFGNSYSGTKFKSKVCENCDNKQKICATEKYLCHVTSYWLIWMNTRIYSELCEWKVWKLKLAAKFKVGSGKLIRSGFNGRAEYLSQMPGTEAVDLL